MKDIELSVYFKQDEQGNPCIETMKASELCRRSDEHVGEWVGKRTETGRMMYELSGCIRRYMDLPDTPKVPTCVLELIRAAKLAWDSAGPGAQRLPPGSPEAVFNNHQPELLDILAAASGPPEDGTEEKKPVEVPPKLTIENDENGNAKIVVLRTKTDQDRSNCIAKLGQLLDQAKTGTMRDVLIIGFKGGSEVTMHWTPMTDQNGFQFVGALNVMAQYLAARMQLTSQS